MRAPLFSALLLFVSLAAQAGGFNITVAGGADVPLAMPDPATPEGDSDGIAPTVHETATRDLKLSGYFDMIDPAATIDQGGVEPGSFRFEDWKTLNAHVLAKLRVLPSGSANCDPGGSRLCVDLFLYYVIDGSVLTKKRFRAEASSARSLGHTVANTILEVLTGQPGFFGARLAAVRGSSGNKELYALDLDGKGVSAITRNGSINISPAFSPDGRYIAWTSFKRGNPDLYVKDLTGGRTRVLSNQSGINVSPAWSPDGRRIAMARSTDGDSDIYILDARSGKTLQRLTHGGGIDVAPSFSPNGQQVAYASERSGGSQVYVQDLASGKSRRVSFQGDFNGDPVFSPAGDQLAFVGRSQGGFDLFVVDLDGRNLTRLTQDMRDNEDPAWSPDGRYLIFSSTRTGRAEVWITTADGRHQMPVTHTGGWSQPVWSPANR